VSFFRFEDLRVYAKATDYASWVSGTLANVGRQQALVDSFCHSAFDIAINIAEGASRSKSQFDHFLRISKTAIRECVVYTEVAHKQGVLDDEQCERSRELLMELTRMLGALIISLQRSAERNGARNDEDAPDPYANQEMSY